MTARFRVLLHAPFYTALRALPIQHRSRFRRLVERLGEGHWDGGTRVKKLRGFSKPVFEARQDSGDRVLFTLAHSAATQGDGRLEAYIQVWDIVPHDRVDSRANRINPSSESEFLEYEELETETITGPPPHPGVAFDQIPAADPGSVPGVVDLMLPPDDFHPAAREEITGCVRWYVVPERLLSEESQWQEMMDGAAEELELKLTAEQYAVVRAPGPVLLSGSAGSGKTTIAVHRLAAAACASATARALYLTYSRWLLDHAQRLFQDLVLCRGEAPVFPPDFLTVEDLYRGLIARGENRAPERIVDYPEFARWYTGAFRRADSALAWEEIRSIVKGACLDVSRSMLGGSEYEVLGRKRAPLFVGERGRLYDVARRWQDHLKARGLADEIDLCRMALGSLREADRYDHLICDEAQDLAEIQVQLLLRLHRGRALEGLFLAGDPQQVINPSGFRWAEVRTAIRERFQASGRPVPSIQSLSRNFRSVRGLVELAGEVLALKRDRTGRSDGDEAEQSAVAGAAPVLVTGDEDSLTRAATGFGPRCAVIVGTTSDRNRLQAALDTTRIFTVPEAKGLEFDVVILWGLLASDPLPWRNLLDPALDLREDPACRRALHHLYVAITRARRHLALYEPPGAPPVWSSERFVPKLDTEPAESLARLFVRSASPGEWMKEGEYFLERGRHRQAAECFRRAGDVRREAECLALYHEAAGELALAASCWMDLGSAERAARCFEQAARYEDAARLWMQLGDGVAARRCRAQACESAGNWLAAGEEWERLEAWERAAKCWASAGQRSRQLRCLATGGEAAGKFPEAARQWEEIGEWERAAACWRSAGREISALRADAMGHEAARRWPEAARAWKQAGDEERELRCLAVGAERERRWLDAAPVLERLGDFDAAFRAWKRAGRLQEAHLCEIRSDLAGGRYLKAAATLEEMSDHDRAAEAWMKAHEAHQQPVKAVPLTLPQAARTRWAPGGKPARLLTPPRRGRYGWGPPPPPVVHDSQTRAHACAVTAAESAGRFDLAEKHWRALHEPDQALRCRVAGLESQGQVASAAEHLEKRGLFEAAAKIWVRAGDEKGWMRCEAELLERKRKPVEAAEIWTALGATERAARCRAQHLFRMGEYAQSAEAWTEAGEPDLALTARVMAAQLASDWEAAVRFAEEAGRRDLVRRLKREREAWLAEGRMMVRLRAEEAARRQKVHTRREARPLEAIQGSLFSAERPRAEGASVLSSSEASRRAFGSSGHSADSQVPRLIPPRIAVKQKGGIDSEVDYLVSVVDQNPGLTCLQLVSPSGLPVERLKRLLREAALSGRLTKSGAARGTRYWPPR